MSTIKVTNLLHGSSASNNVVLASDGTTTIPTVKATTQLLVGGVSSTANGGTLQVSNGITFPATQSACSDVNTLDDYEEGTWTPTISFGGASTGITYNAATGGYYTKIGRIVYIHGYLALSTKGSSTGFARLGGLPFNIAQSGEVTDVAFAVGYNGNITYSGTLGLWAGSQGSNTFRFVANASGGGITNLTDTAFINSSDMMIAFWYVAT